MTTRIRRALLAALTLPLLCPGTSRAQEGAKREVTFELATLNSRSIWRVAKVAPSGAITLKFEGPGNAATFGVEGYSFLIPKPGAKALARVIVTDVADRELLARTSPEAAPLFAEGDDVLLVRPTAGTEALKSLPERIAIAATPDGAADPFRAARDYVHLSTSSYHLRQIALAMHNYHSANGHLPPAVVKGPDGKPWHSWRVLILPYLEEGELFNAYDFSQPWDGEKNRKLLDRMPSVFRDPIYGDPATRFTNYAVLVGKETPFPAEGVRMEAGDDLTAIQAKPGIDFAQVKDGLGQTLAAVPVSPDRKIPWTRPEDIEFRDPFPPVGDPRGIAAPHKVGGKAVAPVLLMDGSWMLLPAATDPKDLLALATRDGGDRMARAVLQVPTPRPGGLSLTIVIENGKATATIR